MVPKIFRDLSALGKPERKMTRSEGMKERPDHAGVYFWLSPLKDGVKIWKSVHKGSAKICPNVQNKFGYLFSCKSATNRVIMVAPPNRHDRCNFETTQIKRNRLFEASKD